MITDLQQPIVFITEEGKEEEVVTRLSRVGYDNTLGFLKGGVEAWKTAGKELDQIESISAESLAKLHKEAGDISILDVRKPTEFLSHHIQGAENFPLDYINKNMSRMSRTQTYHLHCLGGYRSMITASILKARGFNNIVDITNGWHDIENTDIALSDYVCPSTMEQEVIDAAIDAVA